MGNGVVHFFMLIYSDSIWLNMGNQVFFFWHRLWTTTATIGLLNITWWTLDILPGYSTTPNPPENSMKKDERSRNLDSSFCALM